MSKLKGEMKVGSRMLEGSSVRTKDCEKAMLAWTSTLPFDCKRIVEPRDSRQLNLEIEAAFSSKSEVDNLQLKVRAPLGSTTNDW